MFGFFKKKSEAIKSARSKIEVANNIACDFSEFVASSDISPGIIYDASSLPHKKEIIKACCRLWMAACPDKDQRQAWKVVFPMLAQFQEGIGPTPLGLSWGDIVKSGMGVEALAEHVLRNKIPDELQQKVAAEEQALLNEVIRIIG